MVTIAEYWNSQDYENLQLLRAMLKNNPLTDAEKDLLTKGWRHGQGCGHRQMQALDSLAIREDEPSRWEQNWVNERARIVLEYDFNFAELTNYDKDQYFDLFNAGQDNEYIEIFRTIRHGRLGIARLYRNGRNDSEKFKKECARQCWNNTIAHIKFEHEYTEHEATMFLRSKAQWKWERLCKYTVELVRNEYIPTSVFKELAAAPSNRAFDKRQERWGLELNASHPRRTEWARLIADMRGGK